MLFKIFSRYILCNKTLCPASVVATSFFCKITELKERDNNNNNDLEHVMNTDSSHETCPFQQMASNCGT